MDKRFASIYRCLAFARFWKVKFWRSFIKCQYFNDGWTDFRIFISLSWVVFRKPEKLGSHTASKWWPANPEVKDDPNDPLTRWPNDPVPCLVESLLHADTVCVQAAQAQSDCCRLRVSAHRDNGPCRRCWGLCMSRSQAGRKAHVGRSYRKIPLHGPELVHAIITGCAVAPALC